MDPTSSHLAQNLRKLREERGVSQSQISKRAGIPRATWANLESGTANPTLSVLKKVAESLEVSLQEILAPPKSDCQFYPREKVRHRTRGGAKIRKLLPEPLPGIEIERMELAPGGVLVGIPHTPGTREYLTAEKGQIELVASEEVWTLNPGDVLVFRGDQKHSYRNPGDQVSVAYSAVLLAGK